MSDLIDTALLHEQLDGLPGDTLAQICDAFAADMAAATAALLNATVAGDAEAARRARHSIRGLCGNFGAGHVATLAAGPLTDPADRATLQSAVAQTVSAVRSALESL